MGMEVVLPDQLIGTRLAPLAGAVLSRWRSRAADVAFISKMCPLGAVSAPATTKEMAMERIASITQLTQRRRVSG